MSPGGACVEASIIFEPAAGSWWVPLASNASSLAFPCESVTRSSVNGQATFLGGVCPVHSVPVSDNGLGTPYVTVLGPAPLAGSIN